MYTYFQEQAVRLYGMVDWMYTNFKEKFVSTIFETTDDGAVLSAPITAYLDPLTVAKFGNKCMPETGQ